MLLANNHPTSSQMQFQSPEHTYVEIRRHLLRITALCGSMHRKAEILLVVRD